jgi:hypothetical protein
MNKWRLCLLLLLLFSCKEQVDETYLTPEKATQYFSEIKEICDRDNGKLWGENLYGPLMFIDRQSRKITANQPDKEGQLKYKDGIYTGLYPRERIISNSIVHFGGTPFATAALPNTEDTFRIKTRAIHGLFHGLQEADGIQPSFFNIKSMDEKESRFWLKLEWKALRKAIETQGKERQSAIRDALIFRYTSNELFLRNNPEGKKFENQEGLGTFTYTLLSTESHEEFKKRILENLNRVYSFRSYSRSYGYIHGALYSTLLYEKGFDFKTITSDTIYLGMAVKELYHIELPEICRDVAGSISMNYDVDAIVKEEETRLAEIKESLHKQISKFTEKPVVLLELESPAFDFEPEDIHPLDTLGTLYNSIRVSDNWGKLNVEKSGCLMSNDLKFLRISARGLKSDKNHITGEGWTLMLNNEIELTRVNDNYIISNHRP